MTARGTDSHVADEKSEVRMATTNMTVFSLNYTAQRVIGSSTAQTNNRQQHRHRTCK